MDIIVFDFYSFGSGLLKDLSMLDYSGLRILLSSIFDKVGPSVKVLEFTIDRWTCSFLFTFLGKV